MHLGTASDRYAGWFGQIYPRGRFADRVTRRAKTVGRRRFTEEVLPVACVADYFEHFPVLELDFTFYRPLLDPAGQPTPAWHALRAYVPHLAPGDRLFLKAPRTVFARKLRRRSGFEPNPEYLDPERFAAGFHRPAAALLGPHLAGIVFEQEYQKAGQRQPPGELARDLDRFFRRLPPDPRYHAELRTAAYLVPEVFEVLGRHGVGHVLSHWTWLPPLARQFALAGETFSNAGGQGLMRLMTPRDVRYEDAYARAFPFDRLVEGMLDPQMVRDAARIARVATGRGVHSHIIVNNRAGGNAPLIARAVAEQFLAAG